MSKANTSSHRLTKHDIWPGGIDSAAERLRIRHAWLRVAGSTRAKAIISNSAAQAARAAVWHRTVRTIAACWRASIERLADVA